MAREFVRGLLQESRHLTLKDAAVLCVSELVANVVLHSSATECVVRLAYTPADVTIEVADEGPGRPVLEPSRPRSEHGRGMLIIDNISDDWGVRDLGRNGKSVWVRLNAPEAKNGRRFRSDGPRDRPD